LPARSAAQPRLDQRRDHQDHQWRRRYGREELRREPFVVAAASRIRALTTSCPTSRYSQRISDPTTGATPRIALLALPEPCPTLIIDVVWHRETAGPAVRHVLDAAGTIAHERRWSAARA
jgi:hypothetical protein